MHSVIDKFLGENDDDNVLKNYHEVNARELNKEFVMYQTLLEDEKKLMYRNASCCGKGKSMRVLVDGSH